MKAVDVHTVNVLATVTKKSEAEVIDALELRGWDAELMVFAKQVESTIDRLHREPEYFVRTRIKTVLMDTFQYY